MFLGFLSRARMRGVSSPARGNQGRTEAQDISGLTPSQRRENSLSNGERTEEKAALRVHARSWFCSYILAGENLKKPQVLRA